MITIFGLGLAVQAMSLLFKKYGNAGVLADLPLHSAIEMAGAVISAMVAYLLLRLDAIGEGSSFNQPIAAALLSMAGLDGLHALMAEGQTFVWLHSLATASGGLLFATIWLPGALPKALLKLWVPTTMALSLALGLYAIAFPEHLPQMLEAGSFTPTAVVLNMGGGILLILAALKLHQTYRRSNKPEDLLFFFQCITLASAAIMFEQSSIWDLPWWGWHLVRLAGYSLALWLVVKTAGEVEARTQLNFRLLQQQIEERERNEAELRIAAAAFESHESMMITDAHTVILRVNHAFVESTGYSAEEVVGNTPRLLQSGRHPAEFYRAMWETIRRTGVWQGEIWDRRKNGEIYPKWLTISAVRDKAGRITNYIGSHIDITERKRAEEEVKYLAFYDPLTELPNRRLLLDRLRQAMAASTRSGQMVALLFIDLDNFKTLNDTLGHAMGDLLLQQVAQRLTVCVREGDTVARLGGDEFVVMLENLHEHDLEAATQTEAVCEKLLASLGQPYQLAAHEYRSTPSIGISLFKGHQHALEELLKQADIAMYQAKKAGRNTLRFFDQDMQKAVTARVAMEEDLRRAIEAHQLRLYYQVQVNMAHHPRGAEALIRWEHPDRGMISPAEFIPLAEETGLILPIGLWVLDTACAQIRSWQQQARTRDLVLSVNVSARQFRQKDFADQVGAMIARHGIAPALLKLELTESMLLGNIDNTIATMNALRDIGVQLSLDDFGTGYSSLQYLKRLPLHHLKIDQSFVRDVASDSNDRAIVATIIAMSREMGLEVIAEGVETEAQAEFLANAGCVNYQGYLFGRPLPVEQFEAMLERAAEPTL